MASSKDRTALLVLGVHRGGTSATARVLAFLGAQLPRYLLDPGPDNPLGYWEPVDVVALNERLLDGAGARWDTPRVFPESAFTAVRQPSADLAGHVIEDNYGGAPLLVLKDPRMSRLLPFWRPVLRDLSIETCAVICVRHPLEVARSLAARDKLPLAHGLLLWLVYMLDAERFTRDMPRVFVGYDALLGDWPATIEVIRMQLGLTWPYAPAEVAASVEAFLSPENRHHRAPNAGWAAPDLLHAWCRDVFEMMLNRDTHMHSRCAALLRRVDDAACLYAPYHSALAGGWDEVTAGEQRLIQEQRRFAETVASHCHGLQQAHLAQTQQLRQEVANLKQRIEDKDNQILALYGALERRAGATVARTD